MMRDREIDRVIRNSDRICKKYQNLHAEDDALAFAAMLAVRSSVERMLRSLDRKRQTKFGDDLEFLSIRLASLAFDDAEYLNIA